MSRHPERGREASSQEFGAVGCADVVAAPARRPNLSGDLEAMVVTTAPVFGRRPLGYDRLQVDNYVVWVETTLLTARQEIDDLLDRYSRCWAELDLARQVLVHSPEGQQMAHVTKRIGSMLQLAADEAAEITATAAAEVQRIQSDAWAAADAQRQDAHEFKQLAVAEADRLRRGAEADRAEAAGTRLQAELDVAVLMKHAGEECERLDGKAAQVRERLDREAAERRDRDTVEAAENIRQQSEAARKKREAAEVAARERLARVEEEVAELERRREIARVALVRMSDQVSEAVAALSESLPPPGLRLALPRQAAS
jgi:cell division septum initiation protein DivIVA